MITWMQTHKKWLIITIWIATIAFVGAGFVGWGAYSYGKREDTVAKVKDTEISVRDVQDIYSQMFNQLNQAMNGKLDEATAKSLGLEKSAFQRALTRAILIQFAKDNGLYVTDDEIAKTIISMPQFQENGKFSKKFYNLFLRQSRLKPKQYEANLRKDLLIQKILTALSLPASETTIKTIADAIFMEDRISIKTLYAPTVSVSDDEVKKFWKQNKDNYKSKLSYNIGYFYVSLNGEVTESEIGNYYEEHKLEKYVDKNGKILPLEKVKERVKKDLLAKKRKKDAILTMKKLKKGELKFLIAENIGLKNNYISDELMNKLVQTKFLKPVLTEKGWLIAKLLKENQPKTLPFEKAKEMAKKDLIIKKKKEILTKLAKSKLDSFKGRDLGFIGRDDINRIKLKTEESATLIENIYNSETPRGFVLLPSNNPNKVVLFRITEQKLLNKSKYEKFSKNIGDSANQMKQQLLEKQLIDKLTKIYQAQIKMYMKI